MTSEFIILIYIFKKFFPHKKKREKIITTQKTPHTKNPHIKNKEKGKKRKKGKGTFQQWSSQDK